MFNEGKKLVDCCTLIADCNIKVPNYGQSEKNYKFSYTYNVAIEDIEEAKKFIAATFEYFNQPCSRVYIAGFAVLTKNSIWTKERIVEQVKNDTTRINTILSDMQPVKVK